MGDKISGINSNSKSQALWGIKEHDKPQEQQEYLKKTSPNCIFTVDPNWVRAGSGTW